jgi:hypothetical protein
MANDTTKTRGTQLIRTEVVRFYRRNVVRFYRRDVTDAAQAFIAEINIWAIPDGEGNTLEESAERFADNHPIVRAAVHGYTQNVLDSSNKLDGQARVDFIAKACKQIQAGGWASAPTDDAKVRENAIKALMKLGLTQAAAEAAVDAAPKN